MEKDSDDMLRVLDSPEFDRALGNFIRRRFVEIANGESGYPHQIRKWVVDLVFGLYNSISEPDDEK